MDPIKNKEAFEKHILATAHPLRIGSLMFVMTQNGKYVDTFVQEKWITWQAAIQYAVPEGFILTKKAKMLGHIKVDFRDAPKWAKYWLKDGHSGLFWWSDKRPHKDLHGYYWNGKQRAEIAPNFGFTGDWSKSITSRKAIEELLRGK